MSFQLGLGSEVKDMYSKAGRGQGSWNRHTRVRRGKAERVVAMNRVEDVSLVTRCRWALKDTPLLEVISSER